MELEYGKLPSVLGSTLTNSSTFRCPTDLHQFCMERDNATKPLQISPHVAFPAILSCLFSCLSSILIVYTYCRWKDIRTGSRKIITYLSIADFVTASGYIMGSLNYLINFDESQSCDNFNVACQIQSFVTTTSSLSSFIWTTTLAVYLYVSVVHNKGPQAQRFFPLCHILGWGLPLIVTVPILATGNLGYSTLAVSTWCYIKSSDAEKGVYLPFLAGKLWEILCYIAVFFFYAMIKIFLRQQVAETKNREVVTLLRKSDRKLILIPIVFVFLRMWGTIHFFISLSIHPEHTFCVSNGVHVIVTIFGIFQAIGDGGQGWGNLVLYILASDKIRKRLLSCRRSRDNEIKRPILSQHGMQETNSDCNNYGGVVNANTGDISGVPTTV